MKLSRNDPCPCGSGQKYKKCCLLIRRPAKGVLRLAYEYGTSDPFMARMLFQIMQIRDFIYKNDERKRFDEIYNPIFQNLFEAKVAKEKCERLLKTHFEKIKNNKICSYKPEDPVIRINEIIDNDLNLFFKDFFIRGIMALRNLVKLGGFLGFNISFSIISDEKKYLEKKNKFLNRNPDEKFKELCKIVENDRKSWYLIFSDIRNKVEHEGFKLPDIQYFLGKNDEIRVFYPTINHQKIEDILSICWQNIFRFCEYITVFLLSAKLKDLLIVVSIPEDRRDKANPIKYKVSIKDLPLGK